MLKFLTETQIVKEKLTKLTLILQILEEYFCICNLSKDGETVTEDPNHRSLISSEKAEKNTFENVVLPQLAQLINVGNMLSRVTCRAMHRLAFILVSSARSGGNIFELTLLSFNKYNDAAISKAQNFQSASRHR